MKTVISYGGGVQSTALVVLAMQRGWQIDEIVHVDLLDAESPATREYVDYFARRLQTAYGRGITILQRDLYGDMLARPAFTPAPWRARDGSFMLRRQCTRQYKVEPIRRYLYDKYAREKIQLMLGISVDEFHRMRDSGSARIENVYPLVDERLTRNDCRAILERAGLATPPKSSCWFCPYRSARSQAELLRQYPALREMGEELERRINDERRARGKDEIVVLRAGAASEEQSDFCEEGFCDA
jgi:PP-loop superfamily ATP-utilizing enzyme